MGVDAAAVAATTKGDLGSVSVGTADATRQIINVAAGTQDSDAVNVSQLKAVNEVASKGWNLTTNADATTSSKVAPGATVDLDNTDGNIVIGQTNNNVTFDLANTVTIGASGGVTTGNPVTIDGTAGTVGGLTNTTFDPTNIVSGQAATEDQLQALATSPLTFAGDSGTNVTRKLGETLNVKGGVTDATKLTDGNIGVVADGTDTLTVKLAKDLTGLNSVTTGNTTINNAGITITNPTDASKSVSLTTAGLNNGGNQITNVASGLGGTKLSEATGSTLTNAANIGDLQQAVSGITNAENGGGFGLKDEAGNSFMQNLGTATQIKGDGSKALQVGLGNDLTVGGPGKDGAAGKDGTIAVNGKDGKTGVALNGADGTIGLTGPAGANGISPTATIGVKDGAPGLNGAPGTTTTRIVYEKPDGSTEEVATLNDGLKFAGNQGDTIAKKLNETLTVKGGLANDAAASSSNLRVDSEGGALVVKMADAPTFTGEVKAEGGLTVSNHLTVKPGTTVDMGGNRITNIAAGVNDNDAVSLKQLQDVKQQVTHGNVKYEINPDGSIDYSKVVLGDGKAPNGTTVTNVAPGAVNPTSTDAVNGSQLFQTHQAINNLSNQVNEVDRNASAGTASAMAAAGLPQAYLPGKSMAAMAGATYRGQTALAVGVSTITDNGKWVIKGSVNSNSQGHVGATIGAGYQW